MDSFDGIQDSGLQVDVVAACGSGYFQRAGRFSRQLAIALIACISVGGQATAADVVDTRKDEKGWKLRVNGDDFYVKGVVWGYTPRGENYSYNLWGKSDDFIRKVLDYEMGLMTAAGVNAIRSFAIIPPRWVTYIYREHGIMTVVNPLMGRYGYTVGGKWVPVTDYSDSLTRATLLTDMVEIVDMYKNTAGVLMFAFGNESNYGLSWSSFEIENLPVGEQNTAKARYLYSLFNEVVAAGKKISPNHPFTIVNGDIQYIDLIAELCTDIDLLGVNAYRGKSFTGLWRDVDEKLDLPVVFFEFGSDAFNAISFEEDQVAQATYLKDQWQEMYNKAAGNGEEGNSIGGFVFEWRDEWWKYLQVENLDVQDNNASWSNQGYMFDWAAGKNNMNEEWFGITALGPANAEGLHTARPRMAYDVLSAIWAIDPYAYKTEAFNEEINDIDMDYLALKGEVRLLRSDNREDRQKLRFTGGNVRGELVVKGTEQGLEEEGDNSLDFEDGQMLFLDFAFQPTERIEGQFTLNILGNVANKRPLEFAYGDRGLPLIIEAPTIIVEEGVEIPVSPVAINDRERVEVYDFNASYRGEDFDVEAFYHTPRFHLGYEGDFFGLVAEATDMEGMDIWNAKAPRGIEISGKNEWGGLTIIAGPEIYWGANPRVLFKYDFNFSKINWTVMHSEDVARRDDAVGALGATIRQASQTTLFAEKEFSTGLKLEVGGIVANTDRVDDQYDRFDNGNVYIDQIEIEDTLGIKAKLTFPLFGTETYVSAHHAGAVAEGGVHHTVFGVTDPSRLPYSGLGNKQEYELGVRMNFGNLMVFPRFMYRDNFVHANPFIEPETEDGILFPGISPRDRDNDPFAVLGNREARSGEIFFMWDPTGATPFYDWDNDWREDARFAFDVGGTYTRLPTPTDSYQFFFTPTNSNASFGRGLPAEDVWGISSRMVFNPNERTRLILRLVRGFDQSTGEPNGGTRDYWQAHAKAIFGGRHTISGYFMKDSWGPYDFFRQFNLTFPEQIKLDYSILLGSGFGGIASRTAEDRATKIGIRTLYRTADENSPADEFLDGMNDYTFMTVAYFTFRF